MLGLGTPIYRKMGSRNHLSYTSNGCRTTCLSIIITLLCLTNLIHGFEIEGSQISYVKFPTWTPCQNGSISFEFKTHQPNGILFYLDDGGRFDFFEIKLVGGRVKVRLNLGDGAIFITNTQDVNDGRWHSIELKRNKAETTLIVDKIVQTRASRGSEFNFGNGSGNSFVYMGGLPISFTTQLSRLALPSVMFEPRFRGSIRNLFYSACGEAAANVEMLESVGVRTNQLDLCTDYNPCMNDGICISTDTGTLCDCRATDYDGQYCEEERVPSKATFYGREYLSYDLSDNGDAIVGSNDQISMYFKTRQANGLLFYTGDGGDYIVISLTEGGVSVGINLGSGMFQAEVKPRKGHVRFDDNQWHKIIVTRESREVTVQIDETFKRTGTTVGDFTMLSSREMYVGGSPNPSVLAVGAYHTDNFRGCLRKVIYKADNINLDIMDLARSKNNLLNEHGQITYNKCEDLASSQPVTFTTEESFIRVPTWNAARGGKIVFQFRTNELNGLLMYNMGRADDSDFFAFEILEGELYLIIDMGSGATRVLASRGVSDGQHHVVVLSHRGQSGTVEVDGEQVDYRLEGNSRELDLYGDLYVGGINTYDASRRLPRVLYSAMLKYGFVGCMQDLEVNDEKYNLAELAQDQGIEGIEDYCRVAEPQCPTLPCLHRGVCLEGWNRFICDCAATGHIGPTCKELATTLRFDGTEFMKITLPEESRTEAEDITLRIRSKRPNGLIFATTSSETSDRLELMLEDGQVRLDVNLGAGSKSLYAGQELADDLWHTIYIKRRAQNVQLRVDNSTKTKETFPGKDNLILPVKDVKIGSLHTGSPGQEEDRMFRNSKTVEFNTAHVGRKPKRDAENLRSQENFNGQMQQFVFNDNHFFEMARTGEIQNIETTAQFDKQEKMVNHPITFKSPAAYLTTKLRLYSTFSLYFQLKTTQADGLIMYSAGGKGKDFIAVELVNGQIRYIFDVGSGPRVVRANMHEPINDNEWHDIAILRPRLKQHILRVDDEAQYDNLPDSNSVHFDTSDRFFIGGIDKTMYNGLTKQVKSREGFQGCLASLDLDGDNRNLLEHRADISEEYREAISEGCEGPTTECSPTACKNAGLCLQEWNSFKCDCDMTSYTGPTCQDDAIAYTFGSGGGLITFEYPPKQRPDTKSDQLALGFITRQKDAILLRIDSGNSNDYIEMELVDGTVFVVYNMGTMDHPIGQLFNKVNDNNYHVVRFTRQGPNSTIQIDDLDVQEKHPTGRQLNIFNNQAKIYVGGKKDQSGKLHRAFEGTIAGLVANGVRVLELAAEGDQRVDIEGDVELEIKPLKPHVSPTPFPPTRPVIVTPAPGDSSTSGMQSTMGVKTTPRGDGLTDDIIFSGGGSGCQYEDEDDCSRAGSGATDSFIQPIAKVITTPTSHGPRVTPTPRSTTSTREPVPIDETSGEAPCLTDDEDCEGGSGSGFPVDPVNTPKTTDDITYETPESPHIPVDPEQPQTDPPHRVESSTTSTTDSMIVKVNFTETPTKRPQPVITSKRPMVGIDEETPPPRPGEVDPSSPGGATNVGGIKHDQSKQHSSISLHIGLIVGIAAGVIILLLILAYALYKYRSRDEGTYKIDETKNYSYDTCNTKPPPHVNGGVAKTGSAPSKPKKKDVKEWYV